MLNQYYRIDTKTTRLAIYLVKLKTLKPDGIIYGLKSYANKQSQQTKHFFLIHPFFIKMATKIVNAQKTYKLIKTTEIIN